MENKDKYDEAVYKALFDFQLKEFDDTKAQHSKLEDKAAKYLTFTSIIIAALSIFSKQYLFDTNEKDFLFYIIVFLIVLIFISLCCIARFLFHVVEVSEVGRLKSDSEMINFFIQNDLPTVQYNLAKDLTQAIQMYDARNRIKVNYLKNAFKEIKFCGLLLVLTVILIVIDTLVI
ncbi:hypothetical protein F994_02396 [Acinetobacter bohemicus ANC 3994]|uniref:SMODS and SLOG-associating 2TM effector domain-containing protein n=1 Tax=Acinetobacter bohemicus ANC 3994 TaxID=1217715 RepID=N8NYU4_9GAMM|nr:hypothetical protein [Acinetobacter bohemicus]ENU19536.1 hypothetical protein F994_02396 [Acinetobacter bohemicus ANC 3994]